MSDEINNAFQRQLKKLIAAYPEGTHNPVMERQIKLLKQARKAQTLKGLTTEFIWPLPEDSEE